jgi:hypothetical protein
MYKSGDFGTVKMGNKSFSQIVGIREVKITTNVGYTMTLKDVRHVPDLWLNLISRTALDRQGFDSYFGSGTWKLTKGAMTVARGSICCSLYKTQVKICTDNLNTVEDEASPNLWHKRLGHMGEKGLFTLAKKALIKVSKGIPLNPCDHCLFGKQHRVSFSSSTKKRSELLSLVHSDVYGPIEEESLGEKSIFLSL